MNNPYKIMIVDDEFFICDGLMSFHWKDLGFNAVSCAYNGEEALELLNKELVDVIITDIKMPFMDGIELMKRVHSQFQNIKIVLLTGYKEFDYAKAAIKSGVSEYLLKPVNINELTSIFKHLKKELDKESKIPKMLKTYEKQINESLPLAAEKFLKDIVEEKVYDLDEINEKINLLELNLNYKSYSCAIFQSQYISDLWQNENKRIRNSSIFQNISQYLKINNLGYFFINHNFEIVIFFNFNVPEHIKCEREYLKEKLEALKALIYNSLSEIPDGAIWVGVGNIYKNILSTANSYKEATRCLKRRYFDTKTTIFCCWLYNISSSLVAEYPYEIENLLIDSIIEGNSNDSLTHFKELWGNFSHDLKCLAPESIQDYTIQLLNMIDRRLNKHGTSVRECVQVPPPFTCFVSGIKSFAVLEVSMENVISKICEVTRKINNNVHSSSYLSIQTAKKYIESNYTKKITLNQVADMVFLSPSYFSIRFKKETGLNFVDYLKELRINKAKELLKRFDLKIYEIGNLVGYGDATYFANTFKNCTGMTPLKYRRKLT
ncbi:response regulator [Clostridium estertheticum]|uniref:Response regulator n=1 Tax=Clostridium estertheticum TaxID=238834 RepID=A0AA47ELX6_9CLOT|nr:response regulator [Clostridium estertheticum]MBU3157158.1 response regulator [Clostridium estertheticum]WAG62668.1 response regulator [Clostridium estertheticum]